MVCSVGMIQPALWILWLSVVAASHLENSLSVASIKGLLVFRRCQAIGQLLAILQRYLAQQPAGPAVAQRRIIEGRVIADLQGALGPARARENCRARDLKHPGFRRLAVLDVGFDHKTDVRVGPVDLPDSASHDLRMLMIVSGGRMVRSRTGHQAEHEHSNKHENLRRHPSSSYLTVCTVP